MFNKENKNLLLEALSYIERFKGTNFKITINEPINFPKNSSVQYITDKLNKILEEMIMKKPEQWIWSHNRWK